MAKGGYIGVPTRLKQSYTVTNMVGKIGNFETADMSHSGEGYVYCSNAHAKYGERAMQLVGSVERIETTYILRQLNVGYVQPTLTPSHKYYARVEVYQETKAGTVDIYWPVQEPSFFAGLSGPAGQWNMLSAVNTRATFPAGTYQMRIDYNNQANAASMWFDGLMLVDLTAVFGAGNEPDKAWCDANIPFTTSTTTVQWWEPTTQSRARKISKMYVGVPTKINKLSYTVTNMVGDIGSFESGTWKLTTAEKEYTYLATAQKKYGSNSLQMKGDTSVFERTYSPRNSNGMVQPTLDPTHKYYVRVETYQAEAAGSVDIYWPIAEPSMLSGQSGPAGQWNICSSVVDRNSFSAGSYPMRLDYNNANTSGTMWFDGLVLVDLTATFGAGNEPDKAWCDANIPFTDSTVTVQWWDPTLVQVARKIKKAYIGDADGKARLCWSGTEIGTFIIDDSVQLFNGQYPPSLTCTFEIGMTFGEWVVSSYNTYGVVMQDGGALWIPGEYNAVFGAKDEVIVNGQTYYPGI